MPYGGKIIIDKSLKTLKPGSLGCLAFLVRSISSFKHSPNLVYHYNVEVVDLFRQDSPSLSQV